MFTSIFASLLSIIQMTSAECPNCELRFGCEDGVALAETLQDTLLDLQFESGAMRELALKSAAGSMGSTKRTDLNSEAQARLETMKAILAQTNYQDIFGETHNPYITGLDFLLSYPSKVSNRNLVSRFHFPKLSLESMGRAAMFRVQIAEPNRLLDGPALSLNDVTIEPPTNYDDMVSTLEGWNSAIAWSKSINKSAGKTMVIAKTLETVVTLPIDLNQLPVVGAQFKINGITILQGYAPLTSATEFITLLNDYTSATGVAARFTPFNLGQIELYARDGRNIVVDLMKQTKLKDLFSKTIFADQPEVFFGELELWSSAAFKIEDVTGVFTNEDLKSATVDSTSHLANLNLSTQKDSQEGLMIIDSAQLDLMSFVTAVNRLVLYCQE